MNKNRMKTSVNTGEVSLPPALLASLGRKMGGDEANITKKLLLGTAKWLATPSHGRKIPTTPGKTQYDPWTTTQMGNPGIIACWLAIDTLMADKLVPEVWRI